MGIYKDFNVAERLKDLRKAKKIKQNEFASMVGIPRSTYTSYEIKKREPDVDTMHRFANTLNIHLWELLGLSLDEYNKFEITYMVFQQYDRYDQEIEDLMRYIHEDPVYQKHQREAKKVNEENTRNELVEILATQYLKICDFVVTDDSILERIAESSDFKTMLLFLYEKFK